MARLVTISGVGRKGPACFLVEAAGRRILLDLGESPDAGMLPDTASVRRIDAVLLSHAHVDHVGGLHRLPDLGNPPVFATASVLGLLPPGLDGRPLPPLGEADVFGLRVRTGRFGHAPGGVWMHLAVGDGLLYLGDVCLESRLYTFDLPPPAATVILDASYGVYDSPQSNCLDALAPLFESSTVLLPVPAGGRGLEIALHLLAAGHPPALDAANRRMVARLLDEDRFYVREEGSTFKKRVDHRSPSPRSPPHLPPQHR